MFLLRRRVASTNILAAAGVEDAAVNDLSAASERRRRTGQPPSEKRPGTKQTRRLSENEKARISIYLQILNIVVATLSALLYTTKDRVIILFEIISTKGWNDVMYLAGAVTVTTVLVTISLALYAIVLLHQSLVSILSPLLLVNASFFTLHPHPPLSPSFRSLRHSLSKTDLSSTAIDAQSNLKPASVSPRMSSNALRIESRPLIDFSARSSEAGDTPPLPTVLVPAVLSPTQLQLRSLSPAFGASMQQVKEREMEEILQPPSRPAMPPSLGAILSRRSDLAPLMFGHPSNAERSMSTVSYPDIFGTSSVSDEEADTEDRLMREGVYESEHEMEEQESPINLAHINTDNDFDDEESGDDIRFPLPDVQAKDIPFTSSPSHIGLSVAPEAIDVLDPESRQASMDVAAPTGVVMPMPHPASLESSQAPSASTPPPSRVATMAQAANEAADSPRDIFSPTPVSFPQPVNGLPFAFPFLREQLQQRLSSPPSASISQWSHTVAENDKKGDADEHAIEPTPYPSPPFTPPSSRPPTMYSSMAIQMPRDLATEMPTTPDPFAIDRSPLSALVEDVKAELETVEGSAPTTQVPDSVAAEPDTPEPDVAVTEAHSGSIYEAVISTEKFNQTQVPPSHSEVAPEAGNELHMPVAARGILRNPLSHITHLDNTPPRTISPVKSIGRGGLFDGSRIAVDDFSADSSLVSAADTERTLVASAAEESLNEVGTIIEQDSECGIADPEGKLHSHRQRSGTASGADDESTAPRAKVDLKKKKKKTKKAKKGVSFDDVPFVIGSDLEQDDDGTDTVLNDVTPSARSTSSPIIPVPKTFEVEDDVPMLLPVNHFTEAIRGSPVPNRPLSVVSEMMSPRSTADELSDSSAVLPPGQFSFKQVDHYARWFARAHRDKALPTIQVLRDQMKACSDVELAGRLRLGSRAAPTKLSKTLVGEDNVKGVSANGTLPPPPVRKASGRRR